VIKQLEKLLREITKGNNGFFWGNPILIPQSEIDEFYPVKNVR
jgi:hypothetical protein